MTRYPLGAGATLLVAMLAGASARAWSPVPSVDVHTQGSAPAALDGVWRLTAYQGGGNRGPASGQLIFADGSFSYVYTMNQHAAQEDGRAHAGQYRLDGDSLIFLVQWNLQYVAATGVADHTLAESKSRILLTRDTLTITFANGAVQTLERVRQTH